MKWSLTISNWRVPAISTSDKPNAIHVSVDQLDNSGINSNAPVPHLFRVVHSSIGRRDRYTYQFYTISTLISLCIQLTLMTWNVLFEEAGFRRFATAFAICFGILHNKNGFMCYSSVLNDPHLCRKERHRESLHLHLCNRARRYCVAYGA